MCHSTLPHTSRHIMQAFSELAFLCFIFCWHKKIPCILYIYSYPTTSRSPYCLHQLVGMKIHTQRNLLPHLLPLLIHRWSIFHSSPLVCTVKSTLLLQTPFSHFMIWTTFSLALNPLSSAELIYLPLFLRKYGQPLWMDVIFLRGNSRPKASLPRY